jgi:hypothetical protein
VCYLCGSIPGHLTADRTPSPLQQDLDSRIDDLDASLQQHRSQLKRQRRTVDRTKSDKERLDRRLSEELETYDSAFLSESREAERAVATLEEHIRGLQRIARLTHSLDNLDEQIDILGRRERELRQEIAVERASLTNAEELVVTLEHTYLQTLLDVGVPGVRPGDEVEINLTTWIPSILPGGNAELAYDFYRAGSGGKKTLLNVCYALAVHQLASTADLPLPRFLIVDSPMKNIGKDVNKEVFLSLYKKLYELASLDLNDTQFIIIDDEFASTDLPVEVRARFMTPSDQANPPLIPYYRGA